MKFRLLHSFFEFETYYSISNTLAIDTNGRKFKFSINDKMCEKLAEAAFEDNINFIPKDGIKIQLPQMMLLIFNQDFSIHLKDQYNYPGGSKKGTVGINNGYPLTLVEKKDLALFFAKGIPEIIAKINNLETFL